MEAPVSDIVYTCSSCGATDLKLWRPYSTWCVELKCASCCNKPGEPPFVFEEGDANGGMVPAVPTAEMDGYWGYTSVLDDRVEWWHDLPTYTDTALEIQCLRNNTRRWLRAKQYMTESWLNCLDQLRELRKGAK
jgi:hypothetical protein